jgi:hypothetical protein
MLKPSSVCKRAMTRWSRAPDLRSLSAYSTPFRGNPSAQSAVRRAHEGTGIDNHALEFGRHACLHLNRSGERRFQQLLDTGFAQSLPEANQVRRIARQARLKVLFAAEKLEVHVLRPTFAHRLVALVVRVLQVEQTALGEPASAADVPHSDQSPLAPADDQTDRHRHRLIVREHAARTSARAPHR